MLVNFKTTKQGNFQLEIDPSATVADVRRMVAEHLGCEEASTKLILKAAILKNEQKLADLHIEAKTQIVVLPSNKKTGAQQPPAPAPTEQPAPAAEPASAPAPAPTEQPAPLPTAQGPAAEPLPGFQQAQPEGQPSRRRIEHDAQFNTNVQNLMEMGFPKTDCEAALEAAFGNADRAADYLLSGHIPEPSEFENAPTSDQIRQQLRQLLQTNPDSLEIIIQQIENNSPEEGGMLRAHPEPFIASLDLNPDDFDLESIKSTADPRYANIPLDQGYDDYQDQDQARPQQPSQPSQPRVSPQKAFENRILSQFSDEEKEKIRRLSETTGVDIPTIAQVFEACGRDENLTASCLLTMRD